MSNEDLNGTEAAVLLVLMAEASPVKNSELRAMGPELAKPSRDKLKNAGLIEVNAAVRPMTLELTDKGWRTCGELIGGEPPARSTGAGKAMFTVLAGLRRWLDRTDNRPADVFSPRGDEAAPDEPAIDEKAVGSDTVDIEASIRAAYARIAREPGSTVRLSRLRNELRDITRSDLDDALARLRRAADVSLIPEENQKTLTDEERAAAVVVGNQQNHLLSIEP
ncbi:MULTISPECIES: hypothetical protein [unclassified Rhodococcus (in: high G+C Gram-positive bacteria)]|uniref:hypothetical protein n=1 Tax=unclassified Rhodococcus (in: high G+C Gram-positive bacteria) TaxID=192944 RepID=UPI000B9AA293|nr:MULTISPECIES: hypothetical protein [unclassified Rhodococcus (in: high G+C Gram-positive bacteria)]OZE38796.1 hypothetical protein CH259_07540 [Rhodococcus sp. 05-2254-4]OZE46360.1 hypothetical protein CH261_12320 [Rhodococcus sp. 05-2254-3]OZE54238.1 hypothetical protein CH283_05590 [Rhodococcus sp. 05-2254-2]